jgi:hypothetical protein
MGEQFFKGQTTLCGVIASLQQGERRIGRRIMHIGDGLREGRQVKRREYGLGQPLLEGDLIRRKQP